MKAQEVDTPFNKQTITDKFQLRAALEAIKEGDYYLDGYKPDYDAAIQAYTKAQEINPNNIDLNLKLGLCHLQSPTKDHMSCLPFYEKALELDSTIIQYISFYLGEAYHKNRQWLKGIEYYEKDLKVLEDPEEIAITNKRIEECRNGIELSKRPVNIEKISLGNIINSKYDDYGVVITANDSSMYFTSRRANTIGGIRDEDGKYYEDVYVSTKAEDGSWNPPRNMGVPVNSKNNDAVASISPNGDLMVIYREADLFYCRKSEETGQWTRPKAFPKQINTRYMESSAAFSVTGDTLYFTSDRVDLTLGGLDIFYSVKISEEGKEDKWSEPVNLGPRINTPYFEDGVFIHPEGHTLYFSSEGHNTMGGYDIFKSELVNGTWDSPANVGIPMNTPEDELYLSLNRSGRYGYYSSKNKDDKSGEDLYRVTFLDIPEDPIEEKPVPVVTKEPIVAEEIPVVEEPEVTPTLKPLISAFEENKLQITKPIPHVASSVIADNTSFIGLKLNAFDEETKEPLIASINIPSLNLQFTSNENGKTNTIIASSEASLDIGFEAIKNGYVSSKGTVNVSQDNVPVIDIPLKKLAAKQVLLANSANENILAPAMEKPSTKSVALENGTAINPTTISVIDKQTQVPIEGSTVIYYFADEEGQKKEMALTTDIRGLAKAIVPMNDNYSWNVSAKGYITKSITIEQKFSRSVYFQLERKAAREVTTENSFSTPLFTSTFPIVSGVDLSNETPIINFKKKVISAETGFAIEGATVIIQNSNTEDLRVKTDVRGFSKTILQENDNYQVSVNADGFLRFSRMFSNDEIADGINIELSPKTERVVFAAKTPNLKAINGKLSNPELQKNDLENVSEVAYFVSKVLDATTNEPVESNIQIVSKDDNSTLATPIQRASDGAFVTHLPLDQDLLIVVEAEDYLYHSENFKLNAEGNYELSGDAILLKKVDVGESITLNNVIFEVSKKDLMESSFAELDRLANIMKKSPTLKIEISGHTDFTQGRDIKALTELSLLRAKSVKEYLVNQGVEASRMREIGYGPTKPIVSNKDEALKYLNRRVEFKVVSK